MNRTLKAGDTIVRDHMSPSDWDAYVAELRDGDLVEYWIGGLGYRKTVFHVDTREWHEFTVLSLVSREPSWAGARAVIDADGDVWTVYSDGRYACRGGGMSAEDVEKDYGPCRVLLDADGRVPVETVMHLNGVTLNYLYDRARKSAGRMDSADAVLSALGGGSGE